MSSKKKQKIENSNTTFWDARRGIIRTKVGGWVIGEAVYNHGYSMMDDLVGKTSFFQVMMLGTTGRLPERRLADWMEAVFICMSYPDARIWCNQIGNLAGTMRASSLAGVSSGILASDSHMYGPGTLIAATRFIMEAHAKKKNGMTAEEIIQEQQRRPGSKPLITGFIRPVARGDERIEAMERVTKQQGFPIGEHLRLAYDISEILGKQFNEGLNLTGYAAAFLPDQGFTLNEIYRMFSVLTFAGVQACYAETADNPPGAFFPLQCEDIEYTGCEERPVPA